MFRGYSITDTIKPLDSIRIDLIIEDVDSLSENVSDLRIFMDSLGFRESGNNYKIINSFGYQGKYQFGRMALKELGVKGGKHFLNNPELQDKSFIALCMVNKWFLMDYIDKYDGTIINGIEITESGMLASAHLLGASMVKKYLKNKGRGRFKDGYGTNIEEYMSKFGGYDLDIVAQRKVDLDTITY